MLTLTPMLHAPSSFYFLKKIRKADLLLQNATYNFNLEADSLYIFNCLLYDFLNKASTPSDFIRPNITLQLFNNESIFRAYDQLGNVGFIELSPLFMKMGDDFDKVENVSIRISPLYFILFELCSCFDIDNIPAYFSLNKIEPVLLSKPRPNTLLEAVSLFDEAFEREDLVASRSKKSFFALKELYTLSKKYS